MCVCVYNEDMIIIIITCERSTRLGTRNNEARSPRQHERVAFFYFPDRDATETTAMETGGGSRFILTSRT